MDASLWHDILAAVRDLLASRWFQVVLTIGAALLAQVVVRSTIAHVIRRMVRGHKYESRVEEKKRENTLISIFRTTAAVVIWITAIVIILGELKVNIAALMTGAGVFGVIIGFGAQNTVKDFLAGMFVILENQYRVGDVVMLNGPGGISGVVDEITIRITKLRDMDGYMHIVPNGGILNVTNMTFEYANVNVNLTVSYDSDITKVEKVINDIGLKMQQEEKWKNIILEPVTFLRVDSFAPTGVTIKALGKVKPAKQWDVAGEFRLRIKAAFEKNGIAIPQSQLVLPAAQQ